MQALSACVIVFSFIFPSSLVLLILENLVEYLFFFFASESFLDEPLCIPLASMNFTD